jgi:alkylhydroperoxidase family enzyme
MTNTPADVSDEVFTAVTREFSDEQVIELTAFLAWENFRARFNHALGVESDGFSEGAACPLPTV